MTGLIRFFVNRRLFANLLTLLVIGGGILVTMNVRREAFPQVEFGIVTVETVWPGASPSEVERLVTTPLERAVKGIDGIKELGSVSVENRSILVIELDTNLASGEIDEAVRDIERQVATVRDLPDDADPPTVREMESRQTPIIEVNMSGKDERVVRERARDLEDELVDLRGVAQVAKVGWRERQFLVEVKPEALRRLEVSLPEIARALTGRNVNLPGGKIKAKGDEWLIRAVGEFETPEDIEPVIVRANDLGGHIRVRDVATVRDALSDVTVVNRSRGNRSIDLVVIKKADADAITTVDEVRTTVDAFAKKHGDVELAFTNDFSIFVRRRLSIVVNNAWMGLGLVVAALLLFLSPRISFWTAVGIPFSLFCTILTMQVLGMTLNLITMMGFILVIGMLVDDAICVAENVHRYRQQGMNARDASVRGASEVMAPVAGSVLTTMAAFAPLAFMTGIFGKFIWAIPVIVILALGYSYLEAMIALPSHLAGGRTVASSKKERFDVIANAYGWVIGKLLTLRYAVALGVAVLLAGAGLLASTMDVKLFGAEGIEVFLVRAQASAGTPLEETEKRFLEVEKAIAALPAEELDSYTSQIGIQQQDPNDPFTKRGSHYAQAKVYLHPEVNRTRTADEIIEALRSAIGTEHGFERFYFARLNPGPPVGKPVSVRFLADDFETLDELERMAREEIAKIDGVVDVESDLEPGKKELRVFVNEAAAAEAGVSPTDVAMSVRAAFDGLVATKVRTLDEEIEVRVLFPEEDRTRGRAALSDVRVPNRMGYLIPLKSLATVREDVGFTSIKHSDGKRTITLSGDVDPARTSSFRANAALQPALVERMKEFPEAQVSFTGEDEDTKESFQNLGRAFILAAGLIFLIIASVFGSIAQPSLVMLTIPLGLAGVVFAFFLHGQPLGFMAMMGCVGLAGVVVNNAIVLIDFVNANRAGGMDLRTSIVDAARVRLRPILLTSVTTLAGLMPTAYGIGGNDPFVRPMALALSWGLAFSLLMTVFTLPSMILILDDLVAIPGWIAGELGFKRRSDAEQPQA